jgi:D-alanine transaminase
MRAAPGHTFLNGQVVPFEEARIPIDDRGLVFSESVYEVVPVTAGRPRLLEAHVGRMQRGATEVELASGVPSLEEWRRFTRELLDRDPVAEGLLYAQLTGGSTPREYVPDAAPRTTFFAHVSAYRFPRDADVELGVRAVVLDDLRWARRDLKTTMLLPGVLAKREARRRGASEALLVGPDGLVNEGASSNVFAVLDGVLVTPAQSHRLLPGTMRPLVVEVAGEAGLGAQRRALSVDDLRAATELFVTSSSQLVMPVVAVDDRPVGEGRGGPIARELARRVRARFELGDEP